MESQYRREGMLGYDSALDGEAFLQVRDTARHSRDTLRDSGYTTSHAHVRASRSLICSVFCHAKAINTCVWCSPGGSCQLHNAQVGSHLRFRDNNVQCCMKLNGVSFSLAWQRLSIFSKQRETQLFKFPILLGLKFVRPSPPTPLASQSLRRPSPSLRV